MKPNMELVKKLVKENGWSGSQLAIRMGVSRMETSRLLRGERIGGRKCIGGLIKAFPNIPIEQLFILDLMEPINSTKRRVTKIAAK